MKRSLKTRLRDWLMDIDHDEYNVVSISADDDRIDSDNAINFSVINASGGRIVQVRYYDRKADMHKNSLHIITPEEDLATALAHILTLETLGK